MIERFRELSAAILPLQEAADSGGLCCPRGSPTSRLDSGILRGDFTKALRLGLLTKEFEEAADRAWRALLSRIDDDGGAFGTSAAIWPPTRH